MLQADQHAFEQALRVEVRRLRDENAVLRREADRARKFEEDLKELKSATLLQHEDKIPMRLRHLEQDNVRLRKQVNNLEEKLKTMESLEAARLRAMELGSPGMMSVSSPQIAKSVGGNDDTQPAAPPSSGMTTSNFVLARPAVNKGPCTQCRLRIAVNETVHEEQVTALKSQLSELKSQHDVANAQLNEVRQWVAQVVSAHKQYPMLANVLPLSSVMPANGRSPPREDTPRRAQGHYIPTTPPQFGLQHSFAGFSDSGGGSFFAARGSTPPPTIASGSVHRSDRGAGAAGMYGLARGQI